MHHSIGSTTDPAAPGRVSSACLCLCVQTFFGTLQGTRLHLTRFAAGKDIELHNLKAGLGFLFVAHHQIPNREVDVDQMKQREADLLKDNMALASTLKAL